jgi:hypothetical protein
VDFSRWKGENRGPLSELKEQIESFERSGEVRVPNHHFFPMVATAGMGLTLMGFAILLRMEDGPGPSQVAMTPTPMELTGPTTSLPRQFIEVGGPERIEEALEPDEIDVNVMDAQRMRPLRLPALQELAAAQPLATVEIRRVGLFGQILRMSSQLTGEYQGPGSS